MPDVIKLGVSQTPSEIINEASEEGNTIIFHYTNAKGEQSLVLAKPVEIKTSKKGNKYLSCWVVRVYKIGKWEKRVRTVDYSDSGPEPTKYMLDKIEGVEVKNKFIPWIWYVWTRV